MQTSNLFEGTTQLSDSDALKFQRVADFAFALTGLLRAGEISEQTAFTAITEVGLADDSQVVAHVWTRLLQLRRHYTLDEMKLLGISEGAFVLTEYAKSMMEHVRKYPSVASSLQQLADDRRPRRARAKHPPKAEAA
jgi:hypothetical protein